MASPSKQRSTIPKLDPLGLGLKSVPEPLQRWWLISQGNPYFIADVGIARSELGIPVTGFLDAKAYVEWAATSWKRHPHRDPASGNLPADPESVQSKEILFRYFGRDLSWPMDPFVPEPPCCHFDPLYICARKLALMYGIDKAEEEPGFQEVEAVVAGYIISDQWPLRRSYRGLKTVYSTETIIVGDNEERTRKRTRSQELGIDSRGGAGRMLPTQYGWWTEWKGGDSVSAIVKRRSIKDKGPDERTIRRGINHVEKFMRPVTF